MESWKGWMTSITNIMNIERSDAHKTDNQGNTRTNNNLVISPSVSNKPNNFSESHLAKMKITIDIIVYYFEEFHNKEFEKISPASSSATATFYFLLIQKLTDPNSPPFSISNPSSEFTDNNEVLKNNLGYYDKQLDKLINMDTNNRIHTTKIIEAIGRLLDRDEEKFTVELKDQHRLNKLSNECYYIAKAVEHNITYAQACNKKLCHHLDT